MKKTTVVVLCGGRSAERRVSAVSARFVADHLDRRRYDLRLVWIDPEGRWRRADPRKLPAKVTRGEPELGAGPALAPYDALIVAGRPADAVFPTLHGPLGEDGTVQGLLEVLGVAYVGAGVLGSSVGMDKEATKLLAQAAGLPVLPWMVVRSPGEAARADRPLGFPIFVKPARLGSSVGVSRVTGPKELVPAVRNALRYDDKVLLEKGIRAREIECAVLGDPWAKDGPDAPRASAVGEIVPNAAFYTYSAKYLKADGAKLFIPAPLPRLEAREVQDLALLSFRALDGYGMARADFLKDKATGRLYFNELNTIPGFTSGSMYPLLWKASGLPPRRLIDRLVALALRRKRLRAKLKTAP